MALSLINQLKIMTELVTLIIVVVILGIIAYFLGKSNQKNKQLKCELDENSRVGELNDEISSKVYNMSKSDLYKFLRKK